MESNFVLYQIALDMKSIGFDEPCFGRFNIDGDLVISHTEKYISSNGVDRSVFFTLAPLYQQAFKWFRDKYNLNYVIVKADSWFYTINGCNTQEGFKTYKEAENACLNKLIEINKANIK